MDSTQADDEICQRLYALFRLQEENYLVTLKITYIYRWVEKRSPDNALDIVDRLYKDWPIRKKQRRIDDMFLAMQAVELRPLAAPRDARVPSYPTRYVGVQKW